MHSPPAGNVLLQHGHHVATATAAGAGVALTPSITITSHCLPLVLTLPSTAHASAAGNLKSASSSSSGGGSVIAPHLAAQIPDLVVQVTRLTAGGTAGAAGDAGARGGGAAAGQSVMLWVGMAAEPAEPAQASLRAQEELAHEQAQAAAAASSSSSSRREDDHEHDVGAGGYTVAATAATASTSSTTTTMTTTIGGSTSSRLDGATSTGNGDAGGGRSSSGTTNIDRRHVGSSGRAAIAGATAGAASDTGRRTVHRLRATSSRLGRDWACAMPPTTMLDSAAAAAPARVSVFSGREEKTHLIRLGFGPGPTTPPFPFFLHSLLFGKRKGLDETRPSVWDGEPRGGRVLWAGKARIGSPRFFDRR